MDALSMGKSSVAAELIKQVTLTIEDIKGTKQSILFNTDGTIQKIKHTDLFNTVLREDVFAYDESLITETRTLNTGKTLIFKYHLDTLETEVI